MLNPALQDRSWIKRKNLLCLLLSPPRFCPGPDLTLPVTHKGSCWVWKCSVWDTQRLSSQSGLSLLKCPENVSKRTCGSNHNLVPLLLCLYFPEVQFQTTIKHCVLLPRLQNYTTQHKMTLGVYSSKIWSYFILTFKGTGSQLLAACFVFFGVFFAVGSNYTLSVVIYC